MTDSTRLADRSSCSFVSYLDGHDEKRNVQKPARLLKIVEGHQQKEFDGKNDQQPIPETPLAVVERVIEHSLEGGHHGEIPVWEVEKQVADLHDLKHAHPGAAAELPTDVAETAAPSVGSQNYVADETRDAVAQRHPRRQHDRTQHVPPLSDKMRDHDHGPR